MTKVRDKYLEDIVNKGYVVHNDGVYGIAEVVEMAKELRDARKILKRLKKVSASRTYSNAGNASSGGLFKANAEHKATNEVLENLPASYISIDHVDHKDGTICRTVIASIYVLEKE